MCPRRPHPPPLRPRPHRVLWAVSWKRSAADVIEDVLNLVRGDDAAKPDSFPWDAYAEAAQLRGISVDAEALRDLPHTVLLSGELATIYEF